MDNNDWFSGILPSPEWAGVFNSDSTHPWWHYQSNGNIYKYGVSGHLYGEIEPGPFPYPRYVASFIIEDTLIAHRPFSDVDTAKQWIERKYMMHYEQ